MHIIQKLLVVVPSEREQHIQNSKQATICMGTKQHNEKTDTVAYWCHYV